MKNNDTKTTKHGITFDEAWSNRHNELKYWFEAHRNSDSKQYFRITDGDGAKWLVQATYWSPCLNYGERKT